MQHHNYTLSDIDNMISFERQIYLNMLIDHLEKEKQRLEKR